MEIRKGFTLACSKQYEEPSEIAAKMALLQVTFIEKIESCLERL